MQNFRNLHSNSPLSSYIRGWSQKEPMYTRNTSGDFTTLPKLHISAPYTRINLCRSTWSALFKMHLRADTLNWTKSKQNTLHWHSLWYVHYTVCWVYRITNNVIIEYNEKVLRNFIWLSTYLILSSLPLSESMALRNSSEISNLWASNSSKIKSARAANHVHTSQKS